MTKEKLATEIAKVRQAVNDLSATVAGLETALQDTEEPMTEPTPTPIPAEWTPDITVTGEQGYTRFSKVGLPVGTKIDLTEASFICNNSKNPNPTKRMPCSKGTDPVQPISIRLEQSPGVHLRGGYIGGLVPLESDWNDTYCDSSGIAIVNGCPNAVVDGLRGDRLWDGCRIRIDCNDFTFRNVHFSRIRDDAIENDYGHSGLVEDCLFDGAAGCFMATDPPSAAPAGTSGKGNHVTFNGVLGRMELRLYAGKMTHGSPIKCEDADVNPTFHFFNTVFAIQMVGHGGQSRLGEAWKNTVEAQNCLYLNLSDTPLPSGYPMPPAGWTVIQGAEARAEWEQRKAAWLAAHP
jgi:hypothetical protein